MIDIKLKLPPGFLEEEERDGYTVSKKMKEIWAIELDLLAELDRVCRKLNIPYTASGGTLLGAIRHNGFIPWDDDIDLEMLREDYDRFCTEGVREFSHPYFLQTERSDLGFHGPHARLRNSLTTGILQEHIDRKYHYKFNQGIFIDIIPFDTVVSDKKLLEKQIYDIRHYRKIYMRLERLHHNFDPSAGRSFIRPFKKAVNSFIKGPLHDKPVFFRWQEKVEEACKRYNDRTEEPIISKLTLHPADERLYVYREDLDPGQIISHPFEFMEIPIMKNYDRCLRMHYGDYLTPVQSPSYHGTVFFDTDRPYTEYI